jgi:DNA mismatch repair ATPase MutL
MYDMMLPGRWWKEPASVVQGSLMENLWTRSGFCHGGDTKTAAVASSRVTDNGCGTLEPRTPAAFPRHATKQDTYDRDLEGPGTLGFSREALAAIARVGGSRIDIPVKCRRRGARNSVHIEEEDYRKLGAGCHFGTTIIVRDNFF